MNRAELIANLEATASKLAGRAVIVRIKPQPGALGLVQKDLSGRAVMDLDPAIFEDVRTFAETFTHEAAHILKHFDSMPRRDIDRLVNKQIARQALHMAASNGSAIVKRHEAEADATAARWMETVRRYHSGYALATGSPIMAVLKILYHKAEK
jgi:hypothetical protein